MKAVAAALALFASSAVAVVPATAQLGVYAGFSTAKLDQNNTNRTNGGTFGAFYDSHHFPVLNFGADLRAVVATSDSSTQITSGAIGPRAIFHLPVIPIHPYIEGLVGAAHVRTGQGYDSTNLAAGGAVGVDLTLLPFISWRVVDYNYTHLVGPSANQSTITTGLVLRIPFS